MSEIITDKLTGKTTAKTVTVTVGASVTQSLEVGLVKCSLSGDFSGGSTTGASILRGLNISSVTDNAVGQYYPISFTNPFSAVHHTGTASNGSNIHHNTTCQWGSYTTTTSGIGNYATNSSAYVDADVYGNWTGDLA